MPSVGLLDVRKTRFPRARVYGSVRSAHLERARVSAPASILHRRWRYDHDPALTTGLDLIRGRVPSLMVTLVRSDLDVVEVNEPLLRPGLLKTSLAVAAARTGARRRGRPVSMVAYAIENRDNFATVPDGLRGRVRWAVDRRLSRYVAGQLDRLCFGTDAAAELYSRALPDRLRAVTTTIPALPAPCTCPVVESSAPSSSVLFLGSFAERKGFPQLLAAWPIVRSSHPGARLVLVGQGPMVQDARAFAAAHPEVDLVEAPPRDEVHRRLRAAAVLVLPSQRTPTWREQVGLPLVEGLAHGCTVVTTRESGLASWLGSHGHAVVDDASSADDLAAALGWALEAGRRRGDVMGDLPAVDGRLAADAWLMTTTGSPT